VIRQFQSKGKIRGPCAQLDPLFFHISFSVKLGFINLKKKLPIQRMVNLNNHVFYDTRARFNNNLHSQS